MEVLKVSSKSNPNSCAGALAGVLRQSGAVEVQVVGAGALNQAIKAVAIARGFVSDSGLDLVCVPTFADIEIDGESRTAIRLLVEDRSRRQPITLDMRQEPAAVLNGAGRHPDGVPLGNGAADGVPLGNGVADGVAVDVAGRDGTARDGSALDGAAAAPPRA